MNRLTFYDNMEKFWRVADDAEVRDGLPTKGEYVEQSVIDRLAAYEDAEEQGRLIVLPCKVGDTVWYIPSGTRKIYSGICHCVSIQKGGVNIHLYDFDGDAATYPASRAFLTREEAEAALGGDAT